MKKRQVLKIKFQIARRRLRLERTVWCHELKGIVRRFNHTHRRPSECRTNSH